MFVAWVMFPLLLGALSLGCGLLVRWCSGLELPGTLLLPTGLAVLIVEGLFTTSISLTARLTFPLALALAVAGFILGSPRSRLFPAFDRWAAGAAAGVFVAFGLPVLLSGSATFLGYIELDDTATWLGFIDRLFHHGRTVTGLGSSTYEAVLNLYWVQSGYPVGAFIPVGLGHVVTGTDPAWLLQPYQAFVAAMLALTIYELARRLTPMRWLAAGIAFVAAQPALLYAYSLWGGIKELSAALMLGLIVALLKTVLRTGARYRAPIPLALACAALYGILNFGSAIWLAPLLAVPLVIGFIRRRWDFLPVVGSFAAVLFVLSIPSLTQLNGFRSDINTNGVDGDIGNLVRPLSWLQIAGIWPVGDFRFRPDHILVTRMLVFLVLAAAIAGGIAALRRGAWEIAVYPLGGIVGCLLILRGGSAWIEAKGLAVVGPGILLAVGAAVILLMRSGHGIEGALIGVIVAGGVLWSNYLAYGSTWLAPRTPLTELATIGDKFSGQGPTLLTEYQPYATRYWLGNMDPEAPSEYRVRTIPLRDGSEVGKGEYTDLDSLDLSGVLVYRTIVLLHDGTASRPPSPYKLVWSGRYYDAWQQNGAAPKVIEHDSLGNDTQPTAVPSCAQVHALARVAKRSGGQIAAVIRKPPLIVPLTTGTLPQGWAASTDPYMVIPGPSGTVTLNVRVPTAGNYGVWLGGSTRRSVSVSVDGQRLGTVRSQLNHPGGYLPFGQIKLARGTHRVEVAEQSDSWRPGAKGAPMGLGPFVLSTATDQSPVTILSPAQAGRLCGKSLDWMEAVA